MNAREIIAHYKLSERDIDRIVGMGWEDRTPFDAITMQFGPSEGEIIKIMRDQMLPKNWRKWRARVQGRSTKHAQLRVDGVDRFKCTRQRQITQNRISKRG